ncbi:hypothetical protein [Rhodococcus sp. 24CO]|uniref:hypothetical protein n=1 Tax=Rhodococcus sp. 24CO TaxID=3117460 RepID=UPI003D3525CA
MASEIHFVDENPIPSLRYASKDQLKSLEDAHMGVRLDADNANALRRLETELEETQDFRSVVVDWYVENSYGISFDIENPVVALVEEWSDTEMSSKQVDAALELPRFLSVTVPWNQIKAITTVVSSKRAVPPGPPAATVGATGEQPA